jgi:hypothetical protein
VRQSGEAAALGDALGLALGDALGRALCVTLARTVAAALALAVAFAFAVAVTVTVGAATGVFGPCPVASEMPAATNSAPVAISTAVQTGCLMGHDLPLGAWCWGYGDGYCGCCGWYGPGADKLSLRFVEVCTPRVANQLLSVRVVGRLCD